VLCIATNLGEHALPCPPAEGRMIYSTEGRTAPGELPGYTTEVSLQEKRHAG
jgi:hypothetical protein